VTPFDQAMARRLDAESRAPLAVALSGGGDSLALLHLTVGWARAHGRPVLALTVDHGMHPESGGWTRDAGAKAVRLGCDWRALAWTGPKPVTGVQAKARAARHALLAEAARGAGARVLLMGHTLDDVAEGEAMRRGDAPGLGRLREWSPSPAWPEGRGVMLLRPLLSVRRSALRAALIAQGAEWLEDPANTDPRFARVRARQALADAAAAPPADPVDPDPAVPALARRVAFSPEGAVVDRSAWIGAAGSVARPVLAAALLSVAGGVKPPRGRALDRLLATIGAGQTATLAGCRIEAGPSIRITRAPNRRGLTPLAPEPWTWAQARFEAACGVFTNEASLPSR